VDYAVWLVPSELYGQINWLTSAIYVPPMRLQHAF
jgi:hypothetical protein